MSRAASRPLTVQDRCAQPVGLLEIDAGRRFSASFGERGERTDHALALPRRHRLHNPGYFRAAARSHRAHDFAAARCQLHHQFTARIGMWATIDQPGSDQTVGHPADRRRLHIEQPGQGRQVRDAA